MAAILYDRERLRDRVGELMEGPPWDELPYDYAEGQYAVRAGLAGLCTARPFLMDACSPPDVRNAPLADAPLAEPPPVGTPCHQVFIERRPPRERDLERFELFFFNTSMAEAVNGLRALGPTQAEVLPQGGPGSAPKTWQNQKRGAEKNAMECPWNSIWSPVSK